MSAEVLVADPGSVESELIVTDEDLLAWLDEAAELMTWLDEDADDEVGEASEPGDGVKPEIDVTQPKYLERVEVLVSLIMRSLTSHDSNELRNDLRSAGMLALVKAREAFDPMKFKPEHRANFKTYANKRIWGALQDELRSQVWGSRSVLRERGLIRRMVQIGEEGYNIIDPNPTPEEIVVASDEAEENISLLRVAIEALEPDLREVMQAVMQEDTGTAIAALAAERGVTQSAIRHQKKRAFDLVRNGILLLRGDFVPEGSFRALAYYNRVLKSS